MVLLSQNGIEPELTTKQENQTELYAQLIRELADDTFAKPQLKEATAAAIDLSVAMHAALNEPVSYPPLSESVFAGDRIAIVIESNFPHPQDLLNCLMSELRLAKIAPSDMIVVIQRNTASQLGIPAERYESPHSDEEGNAPAIFPVDFGENKNQFQVQFQVHDAENQTGVAYLAANEDGDPVYLNRTLVESDVVIAVGFPKPGDTVSQNDAVYPGFSNESIQSRFAVGKGSFVSRWGEVELANEMLGAFFTIQVVIGPGDAIRQVVCGARKQATDSAREVTNELWRFDWPVDVEIIVATIESLSVEQCWDDFANALITASRLAKPDGPIVIWSDIGIRPDRRIRKALLSQFEDGNRSKMTKVMQQVASIVEERSVFLRSRLSRPEIEELGVGFIETTDEIDRISQPFSNGLLIRDAHRCQILPATDKHLGEAE